MHLPISDTRSSSIEFLVDYDASALSGHLSGLAQRNPEVLTGDDAKFNVQDVYQTFFRLFVPKTCYDGAGKKVRYLVIMLNGLDEQEPRTEGSLNHEELYTRLADSLAYDGIASAFVATPFHLWRRAKPLSGEDYRRPSYAFLNTPHGEKPNPDAAHRTARVNLLYSTFDCVADEVKAVAQAARGIGPLSDGALAHCFRHMFSRSALEVSVLGFSLGGLQALYAHLREPTILNGACVMISSGAKLDDIVPPGYGEKEKRAWKSVLHDASLMEGERKESFASQMDADDFDLIDTIAFGDGRTLRSSIADRRKSAPAPLLALIGSGDNVMPPQAIVQRLLPEEGEDNTGELDINLMQISGMKHILNLDREWRAWYPAAVGAISKVVRRSEQMDLTDDDLDAVLAFIDQLFTRRVHGEDRENAFGDLFPSKPKEQSYADFREKTAGWRTTIRQYLEDPDVSAEASKPGALAALTGLIHEAFHLALIRWATPGGKWPRWKSREDEDGDFLDYLRFRAQKKRARVGENAFEKLWEQVRHVAFPRAGESLASHLGTKGLPGINEASFQSQFSVGEVRPYVRGADSLGFFVCRGGQVVVHGKVAFDHGTTPDLLSAADGLRFMAYWQSRDSKEFKGLLKDDQGALVASFVASVDGDNAEGHAQIRQQVASEDPAEMTKCASFHAELCDSDLDAAKQKELTEEPYSGRPRADLTMRRARLQEVGEVTELADGSGKRQVAFRVARPAASCDATITFSYGPEGTIPEEHPKSILYHSPDTEMFGFLVDGRDAGMVAVIGLDAGKDEAGASLVKGGFASKPAGGTFKLTITAT